MKDEVLNLVKRSYCSLKDKQREDIEKLEKIRQLEQNEVVQEYLRLKNYFSIYKDNYKKLTDDDLIEIAFMGVEFNVDETNNIYVCLGEFEIGRDKCLYKRYMNVEKQRDAFLVPLEECKIFEENHKVINISKNNDDDSYYFISKYGEIRLDFLREAVNTGQEKACRKILQKKY